jgi:hypothetical protein
MDAGIAWLLRSADPSVRYLTLTEVLGRTVRAPVVREVRDAIPHGPRVRALLGGQRRDGGFGNHPYAKWRGAHWRLVSLVELGIPAGHPKALRAAEDVLRWLHTGTHVRWVDGRARIHASQEGNALAVCSRLGLARDPRVRALTDRLLETQWPDGGWNCDPNPRAHNSSVYETVTPMWGLAEFARATGDDDARAAAVRAAEVLLSRKLFRSRRTGEVVNRRWLELHYPLYWHYDVLHGLVLLHRVGLLGDPRTREALDLVEAKRRPDGTWRATSPYWKPAGGRSVSGAESVDWGRSGPNEMISLNALRVLRAAGRLEA